MDHTAIDAMRERFNDLHCSGCSRRHTPPVPYVCYGHFCRSCRREMAEALKKSPGRAAPIVIYELMREL